MKLKIVLELTCRIKSGLSNFQKKKIASAFSFVGATGFLQDSKFCRD